MGKRSRWPRPNVSLETAKFLHPPIADRHCFNVARLIDNEGFLGHHGFFYKTLHSYLLKIILSFIVRKSSNYFQSGSPKFTIDNFAIFLGFFYKCNKEQIATMVKKMSYFGQWPAKGNICILGLRPTFVCLLNVVMGRQIQILHNNISWLRQYFQWIL